MENDIKTGFYLNNCYEQMINLRIFEKTIFKFLFTGVFHELKKFSTNLFIYKYYFSLNLSTLTVNNDGANFFKPFCNLSGISVVSKAFKTIIYSENFQFNLLGNSSSRSIFEIIHINKYLI